MKKPKPIPAGTTIKCASAAIEADLKKPGEAGFLYALTRALTQSVEAGVVGGGVVGTAALTADDQHRLVTVVYLVTSPILDTSPQYRRAMISMAGIIRFIDTHGYFCMGELMSEIPRETPIPKEFQDACHQYRFKAVRPPDGVVAYIRSKVTAAINQHNREATRIVTPEGFDPSRN